MNSIIEPFAGAFYAAEYRDAMKNLAVPMWTASELWGNKESENNFRNCLVGTAEECAAIWKKWFNQGVFEQDEQENFYVVKQVFNFRGQSHERWGVFASVSAVDGSVKIHEQVSLEGAENTRQRFQLCEADLTPIFVGIGEKHGDSLRSLLQDSVKEAKPLLVYQENKDSYHVLWKIEDGGARKEFHKFFTQKTLYLLDGHHRFRGAQDNFKKGFGDGRLLACITSMLPEDLLILPIHRAVLYEHWLLPELALDKMRELGCTIVRQERWANESLEDIFYGTDWSQGDFYLLPAQSAELFLLRMPARKNSLVIEQVEHEIFRKIPEASLLPVNELSFLVDQLANGQAQAAVLLPPIASSAVCAVADAALTLPRKSTQFYPKPALGLICRPWSSTS